MVAVVMDVPKELCAHLNVYRILDKNSDEHRKHAVPPMVIHDYFRTVELPTEIEGFHEVVNVGLQHFRVRSNATQLRNFLR